MRQNAPEHAISKHQIQKFSGDSTLPGPSVGGSGSPLPSGLTVPRSSCLWHSPHVEKS